MTEEGNAGKYGLLFMGPPAVTADPAEFEFKSVHYTNAQRSLRVEATAGDALLEFPMTFENGRWWLTPGKAE